MKTGTITNTIDYFFGDEKYLSDIERAIKEFFKLKNAGELIEKVPEFEDTNSAAHRYFHEWFVFDFKLASGRTPLSEWYTINPLQLSSVELAVYADLHVNLYGYFEVISSVPGRVEVKSLSNGDTFKVREYKAAPFLTPKEIITARVALVEGRYEFVGGLVESLDVEFSERVKALFSKDHKSWTPKDTYHLYHAPDGKNKTSIDDNLNEDSLSIFLKPAISIIEARRNLHQIMKKCDILPFISVRKVENWIRHDGIKPTESFMPASILMGLANDDVKKEDVQSLLDSVMIFNNAVQAEINSTALIAQKSIEKEPRIFQDIIDPFKWLDKYHSGIKNMQQGLFDKALKEFDYCFKYLLDNQTTTREIYRLFANKGTVMLANDQTCLAGRYFLELALKINPNYDFARQQLKRRDNFFVSPSEERQLLGKNNNGRGEVGERPVYGLIARTLEHMMVKNKNSAKNLNLQNDPAYLYYEWLKNLSICVSKHHLIPTKEIKIKI